MTMARSVLSLVPLAVVMLVPACQADDDICLAAVTMSDGCGVPFTTAQCKKLETRDAQTLATALGAMNCTASSIDAPSPELCKLAGWPCPDPIGPDPGTKSPQFAMVFVSGIDGQAAFDWNPQILERVATVTSAHVIHAVLPSWASTSERASALWATLLDHGASQPGVKFNLVCYAVGGIDCRELASPAGLFAADPGSYALVRSSIASITTIATPHRGTRVADAAVIGLLAGTEPELVSAVTGLTLPTSIASGALLDTLRAITLDSQSRRSAMLTDADAVYYQSFAGVSHPRDDSSSPSADDVSAACVDRDGNPAIIGAATTVDAMQPALWVTAPFGGASMDESGNVAVSPTDGMVSVESAKWGTFRGCIPADHYHVVGQQRRAARDVLTGFDAGRFYAWLASDLGAKGF